MCYTTDLGLCCRKHSNDKKQCAKDKALKNPNPPYSSALSTEIDKYNAIKKQK